MRKRLPKQSLFLKVLEMLQSQVSERDNRSLPLPERKAAGASQQGFWGGTLEMVFHSDLSRHVVNTYMRVCVCVYKDR